MKVMELANKREKWKKTLENIEKKLRNTQKNDGVMDYNFIREMSPERENHILKILDDEVRQIIFETEVELNKELKKK